MSALPCASATYLWHAVNIVLWVVCTILLARQADAINRWYALIIVALVATFAPLLQGMIIGQVHLIILASCLVASALVQRARPGSEYLAGAALAFGAYIKYFPAFLVLYYLLRGRWRVPVGAAVAAVVLGAAQVLVVGPNLFFEAFRSSEQSVQGQVRSIWAMAIPGGLAIAVLVFVGFVTGMLYAQRRGGGDEQVGVGWALCTMLLISPLVWWFYLTWLLPAFVACLTMALRSRRRLSDIRRWGPLAPLALAYLLVLVRMVSTDLADAAGVVATLLLWIGCGAYYLRSAG